MSSTKLREHPAYFLLRKFSPKNTGQSKVKQSHKIDEVTTVASAQTPKTLQLGKCPFHYPAAGWTPPAFTDFFPPAADMLLKSVNTDFLADSWIIISFVQTEVSNFSPPKTSRPFPENFSGLVLSGGCHAHWRLWPSHPEEYPVRPHGDESCRHFALCPSDCAQAP